MLQVKIFMILTVCSRVCVPAQADDENEANTFRLSHIYKLTVHHALFLRPCPLRGCYACCQLKLGKCQHSVWQNRLSVIYKCRQGI